jgi:molybdopterin molybdotransferase
VVRWVDGGERRGATVVGMSEQSTGRGAGDMRDTTAMDLRQGMVSAAPPRLAVHERAGVGPTGAPRRTGPVPTDDGLQARLVERHLDEILGAVPQPDPIELAVLDAQGLLCAEEVVSDRALPSFDQAALEGYAVRADDVAGAGRTSPARLAVVGESAAGPATPASIGPGLAQKVAAGAMMPAGADVVIPSPWTDGGMAQVAVLAGPPAGSYVRRAGDDVAPGDTAVTIGTPIGPAQISLLAAAARDAGAEATRSGILPADRRRLSDVIESQLLRSDLVLISGTFAGDGADMVQEVMAELGEMRFSTVAMYPAPQQGFGRLGRDGVPVMCIPGEPVSALVSFEVFVRPAIRMMLGKRQLFRRTVQAISAQQLLSPLGYRQYVHGLVMRHPDGGYVVEPVGTGDEALLARMARANCLIVIDEDITEVAPGGLVTVMPLLLGG